MRALSSNARRTAGISLGFVLGALTLVGCSFGQDPEGTYVPTSGPVAFYPQTSEGLTDTVSGELVLDGECLAVVSEADEVIVPVFPGGDASWDGAALTLHDETFAVGDDVTFTGGAVDERYLGPMTYMPEACDSAAAFFVAPAGVTPSPSK